MNVLITGNQGFIGRQFTKHYIYNGNHDIQGVDIAHHYVKVDARDFFKPENDSASGRWDLVIHCAAVVGGRQQIEGAPLSLAVDLEIDASFFQWCVRNKPKQVVYFSSSAAYPIHLQQGGEDPFILQENDLSFDRSIGLPDMSYGWAKVTGEYLAQFAAAEGVKVYVFRPFSGYGEGQTLDYPFPSFIEKALRRDNPVEIWSNSVRDFVHVDDIVATVTKALEHDPIGPINIGTGVATPMVGLMTQICQQSGYLPSGIVTLGDTMPQGVTYRVADVTKMNTIHVAEVTLEEGIERALRSVRPPVR